MPGKPKPNWRRLLRWTLWVFLVQLVLANVSAAFYAYRFTHFEDGPAPAYSPPNIFEKTWRLFSGPRFYRNPVEDLPPFPVEHITLKTASGLAIRGWFSAADSGKPCILMFHGVTANKSYLLTEAAAFHSWGYPVILVDFRAHGQSDGSAISFGVDETEEVSLATAFAQNKGMKKTVLYGTSLGAVVALRATGLNVVHPDGIIAEMPFGSLHRHLQTRARTDGGMPSEPFGSLVTFWMGVEHGYNGFQHNVARYAAGIRCPVLLQSGALDPYVSQEEMQQVYDALPTRKKTSIVYEASHESLLKVSPVAWEREVRAFLQSIQ